MSDPRAYQTMAGCDARHGRTSKRIWWLVGLGASAMVAVLASTLTSAAIGWSASSEVRSVNVKVEAQGETLREIREDIRNVQAVQVQLLRNHHSER